MNSLTTLLYWLSTGMMIPVIVLILIAFGWSLLLLGDLYSLFAGRLKNREKLNLLLEDAKNKPFDQLDINEIAQGKGSLQTHLRQLIETNWHQIHSEKIINDFELSIKNEMKVPTSLMRTGPMLGLMGTLIPMGPALAGLASGDIASMATNMQVAFSTTVIGVFIGGIGFVVKLIKSNWRQSDHAILVYLYELSQEHQNNELSQKKTLCA